MHVFCGEIIAVQQKRKREDATHDENQALIRSYDNGWVFCVDNVTFPDDNSKAAVADASVQAVEAVGLDFAAVDIILGKDGQEYVLELNTAPGLESPTILAAYREAIVKYVRRGNRA